MGEFVLSIAAAAKSLVDGVVEMAFFSSVGPTIDNRYGMKRFRWPMGLTAIGGDVTTTPDMLQRPPEKRDVYEQRLTEAEGTMEQGIYRSAMNEARAALGQEPVLPEGRAGFGLLEGE